MHKLSLLIAVLSVATVAPVAGQAGSPAGPVPAGTLRARREALLDRMGSGVLILRSATVRSIESDHPQDSDYRENNDFFYLTGLESPDSWLVLVAREDGPDAVRLYLPPREPRQEQWTGTKLGPGPEASALTGIEDVRSAELAGARIGALLEDPAAPLDQGALFVEISDTDSPACRGLPDPCVTALADLGAELPGHIRELRDLTAALRLVKDADEMRRLRRAIDITTGAHVAAMQAIAPDLWEYQLEAVIEYTFRWNGAERLGFPSIVGSGPNSVTLHYDRSRRQMEDGELVVIDIGSEFGYYAADVTRTIPVSGTYTPRQRDVYLLVLGAQQAALDAVKPGVLISELDRIAREHIDRNSGNLCGGQSCNRYFIHGLSHWLGMDVHDVGDYQTRLAPGMVLTIEPGIYIASENLGIRIEDDVLVTATGHELLSKGAPRDPAEIEKLMARRTDH
ncbi:MAG: aminopeptidase P N-terminal domain-containing protein [Longimicrobiales bacterium]